MPMFVEEREQPGDRGYGHGVGRACGGVVFPVAVAVEEAADGSGEFGCFGRGEVEHGAEGFVLLPLGRCLIPVSQPVLVTLVFQVSSEGGERFGLFLPRGVGSVPSQPPGPGSASSVGGFFDEAVPGELAQVEGAEAGTVSEPGGGLGGGEGAGFGEQVEQGDTHRVVGQELAGPVLEGLCGFNSTVSITHFAKSATLQSPWQADESLAVRGPVAEALRGRG